MLENISILVGDQFLEYQEQIISLYMDAFAGAPYFESFQRQDLLLAAREKWCNSSYNPLVLIQRDSKSRDLQGFLVGYSLLAEPKILDRLRPHVESFQPEHLFYISELAVHIDFRGRGIAKNLIQQAVELLPDYRYFLARTNEHNSPSQTAFERCDFAIVPEIEEIVAHERVSGQACVDRRIFLSYKRL